MIIIKTLLKLNNKLRRGFSQKTIIQQKETNKKNINKSRLLPLSSFIDNFYMTDFICENSAIMAKVSKTSRANKRLKRTSIYN